MEQEPKAGEFYVSGRFGGVPIPRTGLFSAIDVRTNKLVWQQRWGDMCYSGSVVTRGGLVFVGRNDGRLTALDSSTGRRLWEFQTGAGVNAPASVFEHNGTQYVVVYSAGNLFAGTERGDRVWLFSLEATLGPIAAAAPPNQSANRRDLSAEDLRTADTAKGDSLFAEVCQFCHGLEGEGGHQGVPLSSARDPQYVFNTVTQGKNNMPAFEALLTKEERRDIALFVATVLNGSN